MSAEENKAVVRRYFEEFHNQRAASILEQIMDDDLLDQTRQATERVRSAFPDYQILIAAQVAEGDLVATVWRAQGTHSGEWASPMGAIVATGRRVTWTATTTLRLASGKIAEVVGSHWDHLGILQQVDALPSISPRPGA